MNSKSEFEIEMERRNFTRAAAIAEEEGLGDEALEKARSAAFKQAAGEWFNFRGAENLAREWGFSRERYVTLCNEIIAEFEDREKREGREIQVFDIDRMDHTPVIKLVSQFRGN